MAKSSFTLLTLQSGRIIRIGNQNTSIHLMFCTSCLFKCFFKFYMKSVTLYSEGCLQLPVIPFLLVEGGMVSIRDWRDIKSCRVDSKRKPTAPDALKTRSCWFHEHHPQRCPLPAEQCTFAHGPADLRPSTRPPRKKNCAF